MLRLLPFVSLVVLLAGAAPSAAAEPIAEFQAFLLERGCDVGAADGAWGKRTSAAAETIAGRSGITIERPVTLELIEQLRASPAGCGALPVLDRIVPADVLDTLRAAQASGWQCPVNTVAVADIVGVPAPDRLDGLTSNMVEAGGVAGYNELNHVPAAMSGFLGHALIDGDSNKPAIMQGLLEWAESGAFTKTINCGPGGKSCPPDWRTAEGNEAAPAKDHHHVMDKLLHMAMGYYAVMLDYEPVDRAADHRTIQNWFNVFWSRLDRGLKVNYGYGLHYQWVALIDDFQKGRQASYDERLANMATELDKLVLDDGSLKDRTVRGSHATMYHFSALDETMFGLEVLKANGIDLYDKFADRLHKAAKIFLDAQDDPESIYPWAREDLESAGDPRVQDWSEENLRWASNGASWLYIYSYRFPDDLQTARIAELLKRLNQMHDQDSLTGVALQCIYLAGLPAFSGMS